MSENETDPFALWFLRLMLAAALLAHVDLNVGGLDPAQTAGWLGFPVGVPILLVRLEFVIAVALILGIWPRAAALLGAGALLGAILTVRCPAIFANPKFNWTAPAAWIGALVLLSLEGDGALALLPTPMHLHKEKRR
jgi:uncharacterized membrane protein YphA (DoxX/SURF4 family)